MATFNNNNELHGLVYCFIVIISFRKSSLTSYRSYLLLTLHTLFN